MRKILLLVVALVVLVAGVGLAKWGTNPYHWLAVYIEYKYPGVDVVKIHRHCLDFPVEECKHSAFTLFFSANALASTDAVKDMLSLLNRYSEPEDKVIALVGTDPVEFLYNGRLEQTFATNTVLECPNKPLEELGNGAECAVFKLPQEMRTILRPDWVWAGRFR